MPIAVWFAHFLGPEHASCSLGMGKPIPEEGDVVPVVVWQVQPN